MNKIPPISELDRAGITDLHRLQIANCILAWAKCESHLRALLTSLEGRPLDVGAQDYSRTSPEDCWKKIVKFLRKNGGSNGVIDVVQHNRQESREFYEMRRLIVHAGCLGVWIKDPDYLLFAPFESHSQGGMLVTWVPLIDITRSTAFAKATTGMIQKIMTQLGY